MIFPHDSFIVFLSASAEALRGHWRGGRNTCALWCSNSHQSNFLEFSFCKHLRYPVTPHFNLWLEIAQLCSAFLISLFRLSLIILFSLAFKTLWLGTRSLLKQCLNTVAGAWSVECWLLEAQGCFPLSNGRTGSARTKEAQWACFGPSTVFRQKHFISFGYKLNRYLAQKTVMLKLRTKALVSAIAHTERKMLFSPWKMVNVSSLCPAKHIFIKNRKSSFVSLPWTLTCRVISPWLFVNLFGSEF